MNTDDHGTGDLSDVEVRIRALESLLSEKGYLDPATVDTIAEAYETRIGPRNGAAVVARAWTDDGFSDRLREDATAATQSLGFGGRGGEHVSAVFNSATEHHLVVCTLCSCYPWPLLGLPPVWYKSAPYRSRAVIDPRGVLADFGVTLDAETRIRVWDSTSEMRYLVVPMRPAATEGWTEDQLATLVTRNSMIGTGFALRPEQLASRSGRIDGENPA